MMETIINESYLRNNPKHVFVFGDNLERRGTGGAAALRHMPNTYGFVTKRAPTHNYEDYYTALEYLPIYDREIERLKKEILNNPDKLYLISKVGAGLANKHNIFQKVIALNIKHDLSNYSNVKFLWE